MDDEQLESDLESLRPAVPRDDLMRRLGAVRRRRTSMADVLFGAWMTAGALAACVVVGLALWQFSASADDSSNPAPSARVNPGPMNPLTEYDRLFASR